MNWGVENIADFRRRLAQRCMGGAMAYRIRQTVFNRQQMEFDNLMGIHDPADPGTKRFSMGLVDDILIFASPTFTPRYLKRD
jgi:hypothetical protein